MSLLKLSLFLLFLPFNFAQARSINVSGSALKSIDPNIIVVNFEVWSKGTNAKAAQAGSVGEYQKVKKVFDTFKIDKKDIQTENYSLAPEYTYDQKAQQNKMSGFRVAQGMVVVLRRTDDIGAFLDGIVSSGKATDRGTNVNSIAWDSDKRAQLELSGLADAVQDARKKADEIAKAAGVKIKHVENISHNVSSSAPQPRMFAKGMSVAMAAESAPVTELSAGQIKLRIDVQAEYEIN